MRNFLNNWAMRCMYLCVYYVCQCVWLAQVKKFTGPNQQRPKHAHTFLTRCDTYLNTYYDQLEYV